MTIAKEMHVLSWGRDYQAQLTERLQQLNADPGAPDRDQRLLLAATELKIQTEDAATSGRALQRLLELEARIRTDHVRSLEKEALSRQDILALTAYREACDATHAFTDTVRHQQAAIRALQEKRDGGNTIARSLLAEGEGNLRFIAGRSFGPERDAWLQAVDKLEHIVRSG